MWVSIWIVSCGEEVMFVFRLALVCFFFFKQKTAYEMRISDWSSDVCSSDLRGQQRLVGLGEVALGDHGAADAAVDRRADLGELQEIGRASCRERVCQYV